MPLDIRRLELAKRDELEIWLHVAIDSPAAADRLLDRFDEIVQLIREQPRGGRLRPELGEGLRSLPAGSYAIFYRILDQRIEVVRILSGFRDIKPELFEE